MVTFKVKFRVNRDEILAALSGNNAGRAPSLRVIPWHLPHNWGKNHWSEL